VSREGERSEWETEVAAEPCLSQRQKNEWKKVRQASQRNGSTITVDSGSQKEVVNSRSVPTCEEQNQKRTLWTSAQGPIYKFWLKHREHPTSLLWPSIMQLCWRADSNTYVVCRSSSYFLIST